MPDQNRGHPVTKMEGPRNHCCPFLALIHHDPLWSTPLLGYFGVPHFDPGEKLTRDERVSTLGLLKLCLLNLSFSSFFSADLSGRNFCNLSFAVLPHSQCCIRLPAVGLLNFKSSTGAREWGREFKKVNICSFSSSLPSFWSATIKPQIVQIKIKWDLPGLEKVKCPPPFWGIKASPHRSFRVLASCHQP